LEETLARRELKPREESLQMVAWCASATIIALFGLGLDIIT